jgi:hypothetical protein
MLKTPIKRPPKLRQKKKPPLKRTSQNLTNFLSKNLVMKKN